MRGAGSGKAFRGFVLRGARDDRGCGGLFSMGMACSTYFSFSDEGLRSA